MLIIFASARLLHVLILRGSLDPLERFQPFLPRLLLKLLLGEVCDVVDSFSAAAAAVGFLDRHTFESAAATAAVASAAAVVAE